MGFVSVVPGAPDTPVFIEMGARFLSRSGHFSYKEYPPGIALGVKLAY
jgi:hypothetical protein